MEEGEGELRAFVIIKKEVVKWGAHEKEKEGEIEEIGGGGGGARSAVGELESKPLQTLR